jgi:uncharacterized membrane protein YccC
MSAEQTLMRAWTLFTVPDRMRSAIQIALSLTLAWLVPMSMGWSQPSTAAITVMIIAAAGDTRQSLMAGTLRLAGTVFGAIIGLSLIALFAQDRLLYLFSLSLVVACCLYLYSAFRGDGTIFMLTAVVTLLVFNGGQVEGAFLYGVDRAFMTMFGVVVYTLVCCFVWPDHSEHHLEQDAQKLLQIDAGFLRYYRRGADQSGQMQLLQQLAQSQAAFTASWQLAHGRADDIASYQLQWQNLIQAQGLLSRALTSGLEPSELSPLNYGSFIANYDDILQAIEQRFEYIDRLWQGHAPVAQSPDIELELQREALAGLSHLEIARVAARAAGLREIVLRLDQIAALAQCLVSRSSPVVVDLPAVRESRFQWLDAESIKLGLRIFIGFWLSAAVWILLNPPGGWMFVAMSTLLLPLISFSPLPVKSLYILFSLGFAFALPCYIFLLPTLSEGYQLALFLFSYTLFAHYVFKGPIAIFFMLGVFTLGIDNTMHYNVGVILNIMLMFYLVITGLMVTSYFVFNAKPEYLFDLMRRRFFRETLRMLDLRSQAGNGPNQRRALAMASAMSTTLGKMKLWASQVNTAYFDNNDSADLNAFATSCELLGMRATALVNAPRDYRDAQLVSTFSGQFRHSELRRVLLDLSAGQIDAATHQRFVASADNAALVEQKLDALWQQIDTDTLSDQDIAQFYAQLNLVAMFWHSLIACEQALQGIDWQQLGESRF